jgi:hypothetical protein
MTTPNDPVNGTIERALSEAIDVKDLASAIVIALRADGYVLPAVCTDCGYALDRPSRLCRGFGHPDAPDKGPTGVSSFAIHTNEQTGIDAPDERMDDDKPDRIAWSHSQQVPNGVLVVCRTGHICERHPLYEDGTGATALVERTSRRPIAYGAAEGPFTRYREVIPTLSATAATTAILSTPNSRVDTNNRESLRSVHRMMWTAMYVELNEQHLREIGKPQRITTNDAAFAYEAFANRPF